MSLQSVTARISFIQNRIGNNSNSSPSSEFEGLLSDVQRHAAVSPIEADSIDTDAASSYSASLLQSQQSELIALLGGGPSDASVANLGSMTSSFGDLQDLLEILGAPVSAPAPAISETAPASNASVIDGYEIGSGFGMRVHPISGVERFHSGVDIGAPTGTAVKSLAQGVVTFAGDRGGYGNLVVVDHGNGYESRYAHQSELGVETGDTVAPGQMLGLVGSTGQSTGPHLHFELRLNGDAIDPTELLVATGMTKRGETG